MQSYSDKDLRKFMALAKAVEDVENPCLSRSIGTVIVDPVYGHVVSTGHNGPPDGNPRCDEHWYLNNVVWPQLTGEEKRTALSLSYDELATNEDDYLCRRFVHKYENCGTCPRRIVNAPSGVRLELCSCLSYESRVYLANGRLAKIGELVDSHYDGEVLSYDPVKRRFDLGKVSNWYKLPAKGDWYRISTRTGRMGRHGKLGAKYTGDHLLMTTDGWKRADTIRPGDRLLTPESQFDSDQEQLIYGSLMGDASISDSTGTARFAVSHAEKHLGYVEYKRDIMKGLCKDLDLDQRDKITPYGVEYKAHRMWRLRSNCLRQFADIRSLVYKGGIKTPSEEWLGRVKEMGLAFWYMDDGSLVSDRSCYISVIKFAAHTDLLIDWLRRKWGLNARLTSGSRIYFDREATTKLHGLIAGYVPPVMKYKLTPDKRNTPLRPIGTAKATEPWQDDVIDVQKVPLRASKVRSSVYCIDVEPHHTFVTLDGVVHNCAHSEAMAVVTAGRSVAGMWMFAHCGVPCAECTKVIIEARVGRVYCINDYPDVPSKEGCARDYSYSSRHMFAKSQTQLICKPAAWWEAKE